MTEYNDLTGQSPHSNIALNYLWKRLMNFPATWTLEVFLHAKLSTKEAKHRMPLPYSRLIFWTVSPNLTFCFLAYFLFLGLQGTSQTWHFILFLFMSSILPPWLLSQHIPWVTLVTIWGRLLGRFHVPFCHRTLVHAAPFAWGAPHCTFYISLWQFFFLPTQCSLC